MNGPRMIDALALGGKPTAIAEAARLLRAGGLVAFPTETVYGLGANALDEAAVARIFAAKGRPASNPVIVHVATIDQARSLVRDWPSAADRLARQFWPGPLTLVLPKRDVVPSSVTAGGDTVAIRLPAHPIAHALIEACGFPLAAPSANRSTRISPTTAAHVAKELGDRVDLILDGGPTPGGLESTVVDLTGPKPRVLRPGLVTAEQIEQALETTIDETSTCVGDKIARSPGLMERHYAPRVPLEVADNAPRRVSELLQASQRVGWLSFSDEPNVDSSRRIAVPRTVSSYASRLYAALHELEDAGVERIVVSRPPDDPEWRAIHDRLRRAATNS